MSFLSISSLFDQFKFYQQHYLNILQDPQLYYTPIEGAEIGVWPLKPQQLFLGDLLQLWLSEKWLVSLQPAFRFELFLGDSAPQKLQVEQFYILAIQGNLLSSQHTALVWSVNQQHIQEIELDQFYRHIIEYKALTRPKYKQASKQLHLPSFS